MTVAELMQILHKLPPDAVVMRRGDLDVMQPLEFDSVMTVQRAHYEDQEARPPGTRGWFKECVLGNRMRRVERYESVQAAVLRREEDKP